jgi:beta-galactosidase
MNRLKCFALFIVSFYFMLSLKAQKLYVGANYHPHDDKNIEKTKKDIQLRKDAGFTVVRMGHFWYIGSPTSYM